MPLKPVNPSTTSIITALESGDKFEINLQLKKYKFQNGAVNYNTVLRLPGGDRLPGLIVKLGLKKVHMTLAVAVTIAMETLNLSKPLTPNQIIDLVDILIDSAQEDYLSLEDVLLFLQQLARGVMGSLFSSIDIPKIMGAFEVYRQERHSEYRKLKYEQDAQYKTMGDNNIRVKIENDKNIDPTTFFELLRTYHGTDENME